MPNLKSAIELTDSDKRMFMDFLENTEMKGESNETVSGIIDEELSIFNSGVRSAAETAKVIQSRISLYLNE